MSSASPNLLEIFELRTGYGPIEILKGISIVVPKGKIVTIIGANGAGKTTTLLCVSGVQRIRGGKVIFNGSVIGNMPAHSLVSLGLAQVPEGRKIFPRQTVLENLHLGAYTRSNKEEIRSDLEKAYSLFPILGERRSQPAGTLSGGEQQMLAIARALMSRPSMLLLDEPSMGVAPILVQRIFGTLRKLNQEGMTILLVEQNAHAALKLASYAYVLETGEIVLEGDPEKIASDPKVQEAYLGENA